MKLDVAIIDYKISNMFSVNSACNYFGLNSRITNDRDEILGARAAILPGVGTFGPGIDHLGELGLVPVIREFIGSGKPFMGICLGMQLLLSESEEFGIHKGLGIIPGKVKKFTQPTGQEKIRIPHIGWNTVGDIKNELSAWPTPPLEGVKNGEYMYFVHSFYVIPDDKSLILTLTDYAGISFCSSFAHQNIFACQFHPEKSGKQGLEIFRNFAKSIQGVASGA